MASIPNKLAAGIGSSSNLNLNVKVPFGFYNKVIHLQIRPNSSHTWLSLSFESLVALSFTAVTNLCYFVGEFYQQQAILSHKFNGP